MKIKKTILGERIAVPFASSATETQRGDMFFFARISTFIAVRPFFYTKEAQMFFLSIVESLIIGIVCLFLAIYFMRDKENKNDHEK